MTHPSKDKGNRFEREIVALAIDKGIGAQRAYASNGLALGHAPEVDCVVGGFRVQAKIRARLADFLQIPAGCDAVCFRQTKGPLAQREPMVMMSYDTFLALLGSKADSVTDVEGVSDVQEGSDGVGFRRPNDGHDDRP